MDQGRPIAARDTRIRSFNPSRRPPGPLDDVLQGYRVGDLWQFGGQVWKCRRTTANAAVWHKLAISAALPADAVSSGLVAAYGTKKLRTAFAGSSFNIVRESDSAAIDVGFVGNELDTAALDAHLIGTEGRVETLYDQTATAGHATAATTFRPYVTPEAVAGNGRAIHFQSSTEYNGGSKLKQALTIPAGVVAGTRAFSVISLALFGHSSRSSPLVELSGTAPFTFGHRDQSGLECMVLQGSQNKPFTGKKPHIGAAIYAATFGAGGGYIYMDQDKSSLLSTTSWTDAATAGGLIGGTTKFIDGGSDTDFGNNQQAAVLVYNRQLSDAEIEAVEAALYILYDVKPQARGVIVWNGDSIYEGAFGRWFESPARRMMKRLDGGARVYSVSRSGSQWTTLTTNATEWASALYDSSAPFNKHIVGCGINDVRTGGITAATLINTNIPAYVAAVRGAAAWPDMYIGTVLPNGSMTGPHQTELDALNAGLRSGYATLGFAGIGDIAADEPFARGYAASASLYSDTTHPGPEGHSFIDCGWSKVSALALY